LRHFHLLLLEEAAEQQAIGAASKPVLQANRCCKQQTPTIATS